MIIAYSDQFLGGLLHNNLLVLYVSVSRQRSECSNKYVMKLLEHGDMETWSQQGVDVSAHLCQTESLRRRADHSDEQRTYGCETLNINLFFTFPTVCCPEGKLTSREQENSRGSISA